MSKIVNAYIDHNYKGHNVRLYGEVVGVNESDSTLKMVFENGVESSGIPMEIVTVDEGYLETIKNAAKKGFEYLKGKFEIIGGMIKKLWNGVAIPFNRASNIGANVAKGAVPSGVGVYLSDEAKAEASQVGITVSDQEAPSRDGEDSNGWNEDEAYNELWKKTLSKVLKLQKESKGKSKAVLLKEGYLQAVKEEHGNVVYEALKSNPWLNSFFGLPTPINECVDSISQDATNKLLLEAREGGEPGLDSFYSENIREAGINDIVERIMTQLKAAFKTGEFDLESEEGTELRMQLMDKWAVSEYTRLTNQGMDSKEAEESAMDYAEALLKQMEKASVGAKPVMVWGAPGIGKTSIIQQCRSMFKNATKGSGTNGSTNGFNINMLEVVLSKMTADDFTLPTKGEDENTGESRVVNAVQSWIPCWHVSGDEELDALRDRTANLKMNTKSVLQKHGIDLKTDVEDWKKNANKNVNLYTGDDGTKLSGEIESREGENDNERLDNAEDFEDAIAQAANLPKPKRRGRPKKVQESLSFREKFANRKKEKDNDNLTDGGIIFFDELTRAPKGVMNVIMNLINDRKVGEGWVLGSHWIIVCAANRFYEMTGIENTWEKAFGTRFLQMTFVPKWEDWKAWAMGYQFDPVQGRYNMSKKGPNKIDQEIIDFLTDSRKNNNGGNDAWYEKTDANVDTDRAAKLYANPRSWQTASDLMLSRARELHPDNPYIRDPDTGTETINLSHEERLKCIADAVGTGRSTYKEYQTWSNTRFYTDSMIQSILEFGNITGGKTDAVEDIEKKASAKLSQKLLKDYVPSKATGNQSGKLVRVEQSTLEALAKQLISEIEWKKITNVQLANLLAYFAILTKISKFNNTLFFDRQFKTIYTIMLKSYIDNPNSISKEAATAFASHLHDTDEKQWKSWMQPAYNVFRFVHGWEGMDNEEVNDNLNDDLKNLDDDDIEA